MITALISRLVILAFGTLYPAYASYKAVRTKDFKEYVKWMMYWIVFALFTCAETFTDVLLSFWFPFYYEIKIALVFWLLSPATKGSSFLYRNFVHPAFLKREGEIDEMLSTAKESGYTTLKNIGSKGFNFATNVILQTAIKGGGGLVDQLRKSYSLTDLSKGYSQPGQDVTDIGQDNQALLRRRIAGSTNAVDMRFSEVDVNIRSCPNNDLLGEIRSTEDISSGYSSTDQLYHEGVLTRSSSVSSSRGGRGRGSRSTQAKRSTIAEGNEVLEEPTNSVEIDSPLPSTSTPPPHTSPSPPAAAQPLSFQDAEVLGDVQNPPQPPPSSGLSLTKAEMELNVNNQKVNPSSNPASDTDVENPQEESFCNVNLSLNEQVPKLMEVIQLENQILEDLNARTCVVNGPDQQDSEEQVLSGKIVIAPSSITGSRTSISSDRSGKYNKPPAPSAPTEPSDKVNRTDSPDTPDEFFEAETLDTINPPNYSFYESSLIGDSKPPSYYTVEESHSSSYVTYPPLESQREPDTVSVKGGSSLTDFVKRGSSQLFSVLRGSGGKKKK